MKQSYGGFFKSNNTSRPTIVPVHEVWPPNGERDESNFNVIFFPGLQHGKGEQSWRNTWVLRDHPDICWPETWLPEDLGKHVRILLLDYDSALTRTNGRGNTEDVSDIGHNLNQSLVNSDEWSSGWNQPIALVGHSFGGLVIKSLVVEVEKIAQKNPHDGNLLDKQFVARAQAFLDNVRGIVFYATPHSGSDMTNFLHYLEKAFFKVFGATGIIKNMTILSKPMGVLSTDFEDVVRKYNISIYAFLEGRPQSGWGTYVVPHASASLLSNYNHYVVEDATHEEVCRPPYKDHESYQKLLQNLRLFRNIPRVPDNRPVPDLSVGLSVRVDAVIALMQNGGVTLGIWGMGGIGKTTIAKEVYNTMHLRYDASSFLMDVRASEKEDGGLVRLQRQLLKDLSNGREVDVKDLDHGRELVKEKLNKRKKVLIVVDDVDDCDQVENFMTEEEALVGGSCVILISRDKGVLLDAGVDSGSVYDVALLTLAEAKQLFKYNAFGRLFEDDGFEDLTNKITAACGGLPLTLKIIGRHLRGKERDIWDEVLTKLKDVSSSPEHIKVLRRLRISFDALEGFHREMFLDVACFFQRHYKKDVVLNMWTAMGWSAASGLENLIYKSLLKVEVQSGVNVLTIHDQLRAMGNYIMKKDCEEEPGKWSRLRWPDSESAMSEGQGTPSVECMSLSKLNIRSMVFTSMDKLRLLILDRCQGGMDIALPVRLKCLTWRSARMESLPDSILKLQNVGFLDFQGSDFVHLWRQNATVQLRNVRFLYLYRCRLLKGISSSITRMQKLRLLNLSYCDSLESIPEEIGQLKELTVLKLAYCHAVYRLPTSIGELPKLEVLDLDWCSHLKELPDSIWNLTQLRSLHLNGVPGVCKVLANIGNFSQLETLSLRRCPELVEIHSSIGQLKKLKNLTVVGCVKLRCFPETLSQLCALQELNIGGCALAELPETLGQLTKLLKLDVRASRGIQLVPDFLWKMVGLQALVIRLFASVNLSEGIEQLTNLQILHIEDCSRLTRLPDSIGNLGSLAILRIDGCDQLIDFPESLVELKTTNYVIPQGLLSRLRIDWLLHRLRIKEDNDEDNGHPGCRIWVRRDRSRYQTLPL